MVRPLLRTMVLFLLLIMGVQCCIPVQAEAGAPKAALELTESSLEVAEVGVENTGKHIELLCAEVRLATVDDAWQRHVMSYRPCVYRTLLPVAGLYPAAP
jgi:hypothetical protein